MFDAVRSHLQDDDDPAMWFVALERILADLEKQTGTTIEVGRCSHWITPHGARWRTADGDFAAPVGYNPTVTGWSFRAVPAFDWSIILEWAGEDWKEVRRRSVRHAVRVTIPSRTKVHRQAAVHTLWMTGRDKEYRFYGFRAKNDEWTCTAVESFPRKRREQSTK